jgi:hypothetical protein
MESGIEWTVVAWAEADGWLARKVTYPGRKGAPDHWFLKLGRWVQIEFKDTGKPPEALQERERKRINDHGGEAYFCDNLADACKILGLQWPRPTNKQAKSLPSGRSTSRQLSLSKGRPTAS